MDEMKHVAFPELTLPRPDNTVYSQDDFLQLEALIGLKQLAANGGGDILGDKFNPDPSMDDPYYEDGPSGETLLNDIKQLTASEIPTMVNNACKKTLTRAKLDRRMTEQKINRYTSRGGIETSYKKIKEFAAWTTSKAFEARLFHFGMAVLLYNMWLLVDFLVQVAVYDEFRSKPRVTAQWFLEMVDQRLSTLLG